MRLDRIATLYVARPLKVVHPIENTGCVRILMYHRICDDRELDVSPYYRLNTSRARFGEQISFLIESGYKVISLSEALDLLATGELIGNHVVITFDDGYLDFAEHAFPVLERFRITATVFLPTSLISDKRKSFNGSVCLTWSEVRQLRSCGITFGSHTLSHPKLWELPWSAIRRELVESKNELEREMGEVVRMFAYPYAFPEMDRLFVQRFSEELGNAGYNSCVTTRIGIAKAHDDPFSLKRLPVNDCDDLSFFAAKLAGGYDWMSIPQRFKKFSLKASKRNRPSHLQTVEVAE